MDSSPHAFNNSEVGNYHILGQIGIVGLVAVLSNKSGVIVFEAPVEIFMALIEQHPLALMFFQCATQLSVINRWCFKTLVDSVFH